MTSDAVRQNLRRNCRNWIRHFCCCWVTSPFCCCWETSPFCYCWKKSPFCCCWETYASLDATVHMVSIFTLAWRCCARVCGQGLYAHPLRRAELANPFIRVRRLPRRFEDCFLFLSSCRAGNEKSDCPQRSYFGSSCSRYQIALSAHALVCIRWVS